MTEAYDTHTYYGAWTITSRAVSQPYAKANHTIRSILYAHPYHASGTGLNEYLLGCQYHHQQAMALDTLSIGSTIDERKIWLTNAP